ncbi:hypothetical protein NX786_06205 [Telluria mixta]|uniref:Uncharacterized protein n=1 Tax=Telluria mixta TaxID=34071 RepID=A0ABT2BVC7_9BURK|nr:hypothetical protein [Telluria mixta]MCS0628922.1 hypothetical protein [Telluria mixta]WEM97374.1 hypothetical protein P0M04_06520 [Telluria mixta]
MISKLERRVNGHCSNPECRVSTSGPTLSPAGANCIGIAAHIAAASKGGPRYDENQSPDERKSILNAIWLCVNCSTLIDRDEAKYTVGLLKSWKAQAEQDALDELGVSPIPRRTHDALKAVVMGGIAKKSIPSAVGEICRLSAEELKRIDPRFGVDVEFKSGQTIYTFSAWQDVICQATVIEHFGEEFQKKYTDLIEHGTALEIDSAAIRLTGSPLFDLHNGCNGNLVIETAKKKVAVCKLSIGDDDATRVLLDDVKGFLIGGAKSVTFVGDTFEGYLTFKMTVDFTQDTRKKSTVTLEHHYSLWSGKLLSQLPFFSRIYKFYEAAASGAPVRVILEVDGDEVIKGESAEFIKASDAQSIFAMLRYIRNARGVLKFLGVDVNFVDGLRISGDQIKEIEYLYNVFVELPKRKGRKVGGITVTFEALPSGAADYREKILGEYAPLQLQQQFGSLINIFGSQFALPLILLDYSAMKAVKIVENQSGQVDVEFIPNDECIVHVNPVRIN